MARFNVPVYASQCVNVVVRGGDEDRAVNATCSNPNHVPAVDVGALIKT